MTKILVLDNYDSFVYTLNGYLQQLGAETEVLRNDVVSEAELPALLAKYDAVLIHPGRRWTQYSNCEIGSRVGSTGFWCMPRSPSHRRSDGSHSD